MSSEKNRYALFAWGKDEAPVRSGMSFIYFGSPQADIPGDEWKQNQESARQPKEKLQFVAFVCSPEQVVEEVRKNPLRRYVLMTGTVESVQVAMPVFVGGKNLSTMNSEWGVMPEEDKP